MAITIMVACSLTTYAEESKVLNGKLINKKGIEVSLKSSKNKDFKECISQQTASSNSNYKLGVLACADALTNLAASVAIAAIQFAFGGSAGCKVALDLVESDADDVKRECNPFGSTS